mgnify:CR=1 FL=1
MSKETVGLARGDLLEPYEEAGDATKVAETDILGVLVKPGGIQTFLPSSVARVSVLHISPEERVRAQMQMDGLLLNAAKRVVGRMGDFIARLTNKETRTTL